MFSDRESFHCELMLCWRTTLLQRVSFYLWYLVLICVCVCLYVLQRCCSHTRDGQWTVRNTPCKLQHPNMMTLADNWQIISQVILGHCSCFDYMLSFKCITVFEMKFINQVSFFLTLPGYIIFQIYKVQMLIKKDVDITVSFISIYIYIYIHQNYMLLAVFIST